MGGSGGYRRLPEEVIIFCYKQTDTSSEYIYHHHHHHHDYHRCHLSDGLRDVVAGDGLAGGVGEGELPAGKQLWDRQLEHSGLGTPHICQFWHTNALFRPLLSMSKSA